MVDIFCVSEQKNDVFQDDPKRVYIILSLLIFIYYIHAAGWLQRWLTILNHTNQLNYLLQIET
jgi:hypothetical protein